MNIIKPKNLEKGDTIGIIAPAGCVDSDENVLRAVKFFKDHGFEVVLGKNIFAKNKYLAGSDRKKLEDLHEMFSNKSINAIIALRGGYGCIRLINDIDFELVRNNPKIFAGYSDITALNALFLKRSGLITYSAPMIQGDFGAKTISDFTINSFFNTVCENAPVDINAINTYRQGNCEGITFGGNLSTIVSLCGVDFIPNQKFIFFAEDLNEPVYKIDKMFTQLINIEDFRKNVTGLVFGDFLDSDNESWQEELFFEIAEKLSVPAISVKNITHAREKLTIPYGAKAKIIDDRFVVQN